MTMLEWWDRNRKKIGYSVAGINLMSAVVSLAAGYNVNGIISLILGTVVFLDTWMMK